MADFTMKRNDTVPLLTATLSDAVGVVNLTTASSVRVHITNAATGAVLRDGLCVITNAAGGQVRYTWVTADTLTAGDFLFEFVTLWNDGTLETFPNTGQLTLRINPDLG